MYCRSAASGICTVASVTVTSSSLCSDDGGMLGPIERPGGGGMQPIERSDGMLGSIERSDGGGMQPIERSDGGILGPIELAVS